MLRDKNTPPSTFRELVSELVMLEACETTRNLSVVAAPIETPVAPTTGKEFASPRPIIVSAPRVSLGMLNGIARLILTAEVGFLGMKRDEEHPIQQVMYTNRLPEDLSGRQCFLINPTLATGGTPITATHYLAERDAKDVTAISIIAAPEGIKYVGEHIDPPIDFKAVVYAVDERLNGKCYIVPGLDDAGGHLYGVIG